MSVESWAPQAMEGEISHTQEDYIKLFQTR